MQTAAATAATPAAPLPTTSVVVYCWAIAVSCTSVKRLHSRTTFSV